MTVTAPAITYTPYAKEVFAWGKKDSWKGRPSLNHRDIFSWSDVQTDGEGNVLSMPLLRGKPCFGMPQVFVRHGKRTRTVINVYGKRIETRTHRCGRCPIWESCENLTRERLKSNPSISSAFTAWTRYCRAHHNSVLTYSGPAGRLWQAFLNALADHGPYSNSNDDKLLEAEAALRMKQTEKWRRDKVRQRERDRASRKKAGKESPAQFVEAAKFERDIRFNRLLDVVGEPGMPPVISKIRPEDAQTTANITADAWLGRLLISEKGGTPNPGAIANWMIREGRAHGKSYASLKARLKRDLARVDLLESTANGEPVWTEFDPDGDIDLPADELISRIDLGEFDDENDDDDDLPKDSRRFGPLAIAARIRARQAELQRRRSTHVH